jgi:hypothetical protein
MTKRFKGKVLKIRLGYNANSSSLASIVKLFTWGAVAVITMVNTITAMAFLKKAESADSQEEK